MQRTIRQNYKKQTKGITLIALVITIIVLLILAGVSISMLSGDNSILQRATDARERTEVTQAIENANIDMMGKITLNNGASISEEDALEVLNKYFDNVPEDLSDQTVKVKTKQGKHEVALSDVLKGTQVTTDPNKLPKGIGTKPYMPKADGTWHKVAGTDLSNGLVITDAVDSQGKSIGNEYVWIEVPNLYDATGKKVINDEGVIGPDYSNVKAGSTDYTNIKTALLNYTKTLLPDGTNNKSTNMGWKDEWYDKNNKKAGDDGVDLTSTEGCGLTSTKYTEYYNAMLKSVYEHGGFWIGRYETGIEGTEIGESETTKTGARAYGSQTSTIHSTDDHTPVIKANVMPYNWVRCYQAQQLANSMNSGDCRSSLMFGVQWDLVLKYLENKATWKSGRAASNLTSDSKDWGNYNNTLYNITNTKVSYSTDSGANWTKANPLKKESNGNYLLTTGANTDFKKQNIYELAGNVWEWTLEHATSESSAPCAERGGNFSSTGSYYPASYRYGSSTTNSSLNIGFRVSLY